MALYGPFIFLQGLLYYAKGGTMKQLLIYRHAKTEEKKGDMKDFDRVLIERGRKDANTIGKVLSKQSVMPDLIISSSAKRALETGSITAKALGYEGTIEEKEELYSTDPITYYDVISSVSDSINTLMIVGHNPEIEDFLEDISGAPVEAKTANLFRIRLPISHWTEVVGLSKADIEERIKP